MDGGTGAARPDPSNWDSSQKEPPARESLFDSDETQEGYDISQTSLASLKRYQPGNVLLPRVKAKTGMADDDEDGEKIVRNDLPGDSYPTNGSVGNLTTDDGSSKLDLISAQSPHSSYKHLFSPTKATMSIEDRIKDLQMKLAQEVLLLNDADADTLVYINPPPQQPEQDDLEYKEYRDRCLKPHRVHSKKFLALGSSYFEKAFGPTKQHRVQGKRGLRNNLPHGIKYVLDLTPPTEGEDAAYLMTELSCSTGVRMWFQAEKHWDVSKSLVGGYDEFEPHRENDRYQSTPSTDYQPSTASKPDMPSSQEMIDPKTPEKKPKHILNWDGNLPKPPAFVVQDLKSSPVQDSEPVGSPNGQDCISPRKGVGWSIPLDYSPVRHHSAIERVLHAIEGLDPKLDSAPKIFTFFAVAKYFDCASHVADWVIRWMYATPNSFFIELHPEVVCRIAGGVQCLALYRDAYAILVGEEALDNIRRTRNNGRMSRHLNSYGRVKEDLTEGDQTRVEYGSKSFIERIYNTFLSFIDDHMIWLLDAPEFRMVQDFQSDSTYRMNLRQKLLYTLKAYVRGRFLCVLTRSYNGTSLHLKDSSPLSGYPNPSYTDVYNTLSIRERIFSRTAWALINRENFGAGESNTFTDGTLFIYPDAVTNVLMQEAKDDFNLKAITKKYLAILVHDFQDAQLAEAKVRKAVEAADGDVLRPIEKELPFHLKVSPGNVGMNETLILPDRALVPYPQAGDGISSLSSFEDLSVTNISERKESGVNAKSRDKRRKLSETEELLIDLSDSEFGNESAPVSSGDTSQEGPKKLQIPNPTAETDEEGNKVENEGHPEIPPNRHHNFAYQRTTNENGLPVFTMADGQLTSAQSSKSQRFSGQSSVLQDNASGKRPASPMNTNLTLVDGTPHTARDFYAPTFSLQCFFRDVNIHVRKLCQKMLASANQELGYDALSPRLTDTLVCLEDNEWRYLPLWAGGCDDGSGGVFAQGVPSVEFGGFSAPGPDVHTGSASSSEHSFDMVEMSSSRDTSTVVQDGFSDTLDRNRVYEADSLWGEVMANKEAHYTGALVDKGKGKVSYVDENEDAQTMIPASIDHQSSVKYDFGSDIEEDDVKSGFEEDEDPFTDANEFDPDQFIKVEDADDEDDAVMV